MPLSRYKYNYMLTDHQGSIIRAYSEAGTEVFAASYDAWGKQTVERNAIGLRRGYTSHEMLADFKLWHRRRPLEVDAEKALRPKPQASTPTIWGEGSFRV